MNQTLSVIDEHITDMNKPSSGTLGADWSGRRGTNDSGSEYSGERRLSYINGAETDEEEGHTEEEVMSWNPDRVAEYLLDIGVEKLHCDVFREQEFSGEVILGMDQSSIFLKELELGPIGRRLKTWQKIKALQEEVKTAQSSKKSRVPQTGTSGISRQTSSGMPSLPRISQASNETDSPRNSTFSAPARASTEPARMENFAPLIAVSTSIRHHSPRPSAASIREMGHARRQSSVDQTYAAPGSAGPSRRQSTADSNYPAPIAVAGLSSGYQGSHNKQPSFDRSWTMEGAINRAQLNVAPRPQSVVHMYSMSSDRAQFEKPQDSSIPATEDGDREYISSGELEIKRQRNIALKKNLSLEHNRHPSYASENRRSFFRAGSKPQNILRPGEATSPEEMGNTLPPPMNTRIVSEPVMERPPIVTRLEQGRSTLGQRSPAQTEDSSDGKADSSSRASSSIAPSTNLRAVSDAVTGREKALVAGPADESALDQSVVPSPSLASSGTPSAASKSFEMEDGAQQMVGSGATSQAARMRPRSKKTTSAYLRGLEKKSPREQMVDCDYSGWMKKKSSNLMTTWKPRLFVLRGRRLSYYYSENDTEEKGLIDISNHRVLPAGNERLTGLHAALTGAGSTPSSPQVHSSGFSPHSSTNGGSTPQSGSPMSSAFSLPGNSPKEGGNQTFLFKLVPPRTGLSRAVNFTKPTVHYFAVSSLEEGRLWMGAMMKATIDRDESAEVKTTYQQKTISLASARARKERPPALRAVNENGSGPATSGAQEQDGANEDATDEPVSPAAPGQYATDLATVPEAVSPVSLMFQSPIYPTTRPADLQIARDVTVLDVGRNTPNDANTDLHKVKSTSSIKSGHSWSASSLKKSASSHGQSQGQGLGINGLNNASIPTSPVIGRMQNAGLW